jgi:hypothetical protein
LAISGVEFLLGYVGAAAIAMALAFDRREVVCNRRQCPIRLDVTVGQDDLSGVYEGYAGRRVAG